MELSRLILVSDSVSPRRVYPHLCGLTRSKHSSPVPTTGRCHPFSDGFGLMRDTQTDKPQSFRTGDGWFAFNLATNLAQMKVIKPPRLPPDRRTKEALCSPHSSSNEVRNVDSPGGATAVQETRERKQNRWLETGMDLVKVCLVLLLGAFLLAISPFLLLYHVYMRMYYGPPVDAAQADSKDDHDCRDYARGYAQGLEDADNHRRRADEAEREVERLHKQLRDRQ